MFTRGSVAVNTSNSKLLCILLHSPIRQFLTENYKVFNPKLFNLQFSRNFRTCKNWTYLKKNHLELKLHKNLLSNISTVSFQSVFQASKMDSPPKEPIDSTKKNAESKSSDDVQKNSSSKNAKAAISLDHIKTWTDYFQQLPEDRHCNDADLKLDEFTVNPSLNSKISLFQGDLTKLDIDCIVNAANSHLIAGGGVDGAIHRAAGPELQEECDTLDGCSTGDAKITKGYNLPAKHVIHAVGPRGEKPKFLASCYSKALEIMLENGLKTMAFPCISTGIYGYPQDAAAHVALRTTREFLTSNSEKVDRIIFCVFLQKDLEIYEDLLQIYFPN